MLIVWLVSTVWVGIDASARDWSQVDGAGPHSTGGWIAFCLLFGILVVPRYLWVRRRAPKLSELTAANGGALAAGDAPVAAGWYPDPTRLSQAALVGWVPLDRTLRHVRCGPAGAQRAADTQLAVWQFSLPLYAGGRGSFTRSQSELPIWPCGEERNGQPL